MIVIGVIVGASLLCIHVNLVFYGVIVVGNGGGSVACCDFSYCSSSRMCGGVAWDWSMCLQGAGRRWRGSAQRAGQREFFPWAGNKFSRSAGCKFPIRAGGASSLKTGGPLGAAAVAETGEEGVVYSYL